MELILAAMERTEAEMGQTSDGQSGSDEALPSTLSLWQHLSTQVSYFNSVAVLIDSKFS